MASKREIVVTGVGVVSPIGIGIEPFWRAVLEGQSGVAPITSFDTSGLPVRIGAEVRDFDPKQYITPRKSLKIMSRDIQLGVAAAHLACQQAGLDEQVVEPERLGVVFATDMMQCDLTDVEATYRRSVIDGRFRFGDWYTEAAAQINPLWMLMYLPNMTACHIAIARDARGPNNTMTLGEVSSLLAIAEAARVLERGQADVVITGGTSARIHPISWVRHTLREVSKRNDDPQSASRPFDADRDGAVHGEGAASFILEDRARAEARGAKILARVLGYASALEPCTTRGPMRGTAIRTALAGALAKARLSPRDVGHVNPHGLSATHDDRVEATAIHEQLPDVPALALKSLFGCLGGAGGAVEMAASVMALQTGELPPSRNYDRPDPACPIRVVHGRVERASASTAVLMNHAPTGQAAALVLAGP